MGGSAHNFPVEVDEAISQPVPPQPETGDFAPPVKLNLPKLTRALQKDFLNWLKRKLRHPTESSKAALQYLRRIPFDVAVEAHPRIPADQPRHYVSFSFPGCAGNAEVSARVASHWARLWYATERTRIAEEILIRHKTNAAPRNATDDSDDFLFVPAGDWGYAAYEPEYTEDDELRDDPSNQRFQLDVAYVEGDHPAALQVLRQIEELFTPQMQAGRCFCQLCDPRFDFHPSA
jgi:hypothetical protein